MAGVMVSGLCLFCPEFNLSVISQTSPTSRMDRTTKMVSTTSTWRACQVRRTYWGSAPLYTSKEVAKGSGSTLSAYFVFLFLKLIRSSYDRYERYIASPGYTGLTCPQGHRLLARLYKSTGRHCDMCETGFEEQHTGKCCKVRALLYDFFFIHESFRFATMTCAPRVCCWTLQSSPFRRPTPSMTSPFNRPTPSMSMLNRNCCS